MKTKTVSLHYKRARADAVAHGLNHSLAATRDRRVRVTWLGLHELPVWTTRFVVKRARTRFHYKVVATDG